MRFSEMLGILRAEARGEVPEGWVPHTMLCAFVAGRIVGRADVRHRLNDYLRRRGGHVGYAVAPAFRRRGYATEMMRQALGHCTSLGLDRILVTCADDNEPSWRIIERFGGELEDRVWDPEDQETIRRYWLALPSPGTQASRQVL